MIAHMDILHRHEGILYDIHVVCIVLPPSEIVHSLHLLTSISGESLLIANCPLFVQWGPKAAFISFHFHFVRMISN